MKKIAGSRNYIMMNKEAGPRRRSREVAESMGANNHYIFTVQLHSPEDISDIDVESISNALAIHVGRNSKLGREIDVGYSNPSLRNR